MKNVRRWCNAPYLLAIHVLVAGCGEESGRIDADAATLADAGADVPEEKGKGVDASPDRIRTLSLGFSGEIDGELVLYQQGEDGFSSGVSSSSSLRIPPELSTASYGSQISRAGAPGDGLHVTIGEVEFPGNEPSDELFYGLFAVGAVPFDPVRLKMVWTDGDGTRWASEPGEQAASSFEVTSVIRGAPAGRSGAAVRVEASFNCTVYADGGRSKLLQNGRYIGYFSKN